MTRNRFNQTKNKGASGNPLHGSSNNLTLSKARGLFLEDNDNIAMKDTYKITNVHPPIHEKDVVEYCDNCDKKKEYCDNNKIDNISKNITELRKGDFL